MISEGGSGLLFLFTHFYPSVNEDGGQNDCRAYVKCAGKLLVFMENEVGEDDSVKCFQIQCK